MRLLTAVLLLLLILAGCSEVPTTERPAQPEQPLRIPRPPTSVVEDPGFSDEPSLAVTSDGSIYVAYVSFREGRDTLQVVRYQRSGEGFTGSIQGLAPGRFAAAFNQAPLRRRSPSMILDWGLDRIGVWRGQGLPPAHLLRQVFEQARDYEEARKRLSEAPLAMPALFSLAGPRPEQGCVIERLERQAFVHDGPQVVANHWLGPRPKARARGEDSEGRAATMEREAGTAARNLEWLKPPVLNPTTRLAMVAEPASGRLIAQGFEEDGPATAVTEIQA